MQSWLDLYWGSERTQSILSCALQKILRDSEKGARAHLLNKMAHAAMHQKSWLTMKLSILLTPNRLLCDCLAATYLCFTNHTCQQWLEQKLTLVIHNYTCCWNANLYFFQWLLSWLLHKWREGYLLPTWARKITCRCFDWMLQSSSGGWWWLCMFTSCYISHAVLRPTSSAGLASWATEACNARGTPVRTHARTRTHRAVLLRGSIKRGLAN